MNVSIFASWNRRLIAGLFLCAVSPAAAFTITPVYVDGDTQTWDATKKSVVAQAISDWTSKLIFPSGNAQNITMTFDFTHAGTSSYLGLWSGGFSANFGANLYPYSSQVTHTININADLMNSALPNYLAFSLTQPPFAQWDALSVVRHELGHALGFSTLYLDNNGNSSADKWDDRITVSGSTATFDVGTGNHLNISLDSSSNVSHILDSGPTAGDLMVPNLFNGVRRTISNTDLEMLSMAYNYGINTIAGDANLDGVVDQNDYLAIDYGYLHQLRGWSNGDFNEDGTINAADYRILDASYRAHGGTADGEISLDPTLVPEPGTLGLLGIGLSAMAGSRRRKAI